MTLGDQHRPLRDVIFEEIRNRIVRNEMAPGSRLVESQLAADLGVSRNPVREAIRMLETEGFVVVTPRRGAVVTEMSPRQAEEIFEVRSVLEALSARLAARNISPIALERLVELLDKGDRLVADGDSAGITALNAQFHEEIVEAAGNETLTHLTRQLRDRLEWIFSRTATERGDQSWNEHRNLLGAIAAHDEQLAEALATAHVAAARRAFEADTEAAAEASAGGDGEG